MRYLNDFAIEFTPDVPILFELVFEINKKYIIKIALKINK